MLFSLIFLGTLIFLADRSEISNKRVDKAQSEMSRGQTKDILSPSAKKINIHISVIHKLCDKKLIEYQNQTLNLFRLFEHFSNSCFEFFFYYSNFLTTK